MSKTYQDYRIDLPMDATGQHYTICPNCSHKRKKSNDPCLGIDADKQIWHCNHCGWSGSLNHKAESKPVKPQPVKIAWTPGVKLPEKVVEYFKKRGISEKILKLNDIQFKDSVYFPQVEKKAGAICFPYKRNGEVINVKYRSGEKNFIQVKNAEKIFFGLDSIQKNETTLIITEGEIDCLSFYEIGYNFAVSVPDGAPAQGAKNFNSKFDYLKNCKSFLSRFQQIILAVDNDYPGKVLKRELARRLGFDRCYSVTFPDSCKDVNDVLLKHEKDGLIKLIGSAKLFDSQGLTEFVPVNRIEFPGHFIDEIISDISPPPEFIIERILPKQSIGLIVAPPKSFKTMLALNLAIALASGKSYHDFQISKPQKIFYCQSEMAYFAIRDQRLKPMMQNDFANPENRLFITDRKSFNILDSDNFLSLAAILISYDVVFFDPFIAYHISDENSNDQMQRVMERFREVTTLSDVSIILIHHSRKAFDGSGGSNARGASAIFGAVDSYIELKKIGTSHIEIFFDLRYGAPVEKATYKLNPSTLWLEKLDVLGTIATRNQRIFSIIREAGGYVLNSVLKKRIESSFSVSNTTAALWIKNLIKTGRLESDGKQRNATIFLPKEGEK